MRPATTCANCGLVRVWAAPTAPRGLYRAICPAPARPFELDQPPHIPPRPEREKVSAHPHRLAAQETPPLLDHASPQSEPAGTLERANVEVTEEMVALIAAQRNFQANAKALDAESTMSQTIINIRPVVASIRPANWRSASISKVATRPATAALDQTTPADWFDAMGQRYEGFNVAAIDELAEGLGLGPHLAKPGTMLSAGTKRKVWLAAAFAAGAAVTLLDEPFAALDMASINIVIERLTEAARDSTRTWVLADYEAPRGVPLAATIDLGS